jgi:hypothetical protein
VGGKIAQLGQRLIDGVAKSMAEDFFKRFELALQEKYPDSILAQPSEDQEEGASTQPSSAQAQHLRMFKWLWPLVVGVVGGVAFWWLTR